MGSLAADVNHGSGRQHEIWLADVVARFFLLDHTFNVIGELLVTGAMMHTASEVVIEK